MTVNENFSFGQLSDRQTPVPISKSLSVSVLEVGDKDSNCDCLEDKRYCQVCSVLQCFKLLKLKFILFGKNIASV